MTFASRGHPWFSESQILPMKLNHYCLQIHRLKKPKKSLSASPSVMRLVTLQNVELLPGAFAQILNDILWNPPVTRPSHSLGED